MIYSNRFMLILTINKNYAIILDILSILKTVQQHFYQINEPGHEIKTNLIIPDTDFKNWIASVCDT